MFTKLHTEAALSLFCKFAVEAINEHSSKSIPSAEELHGLIMRKVYGDEESSSPAKNVPRDDVAKKVEVPEVVQEVPLAESPKKTINLTSKDLKKQPLKIKKKELKDGDEVEVEVEIAFPYLAEVDYSDTCQSLKVNGGLFTPCLTRPAKDSKFCKSCAKADHKYGTMEQRSNCSMLCYVDPNGKKEISFGTWLKKRGVERAIVESKIQEQYGISLPQEYWVPDKSKAARAVKTVSTSSDDEASVEGDKPAPKKAVRKPKKESVAEVAPVEETKEDTKSEASADEASAEGDKPAPKKRGRPKKVIIAVPEETKPEASADEVSETPEKPDTPVTDELTEEPISDEENAQEEVEVESEEEGEKPEMLNGLPRKNGAVRKLENPEHNLVFWDDNTYVIDLDDNCLWTHDEDNEILTCVGEWNPETREVTLD
jgi:hypothetical protein